MLTGGALGIALGSALGLTLYFGLLRIPARHLFTVTSGLILFLAAGMAAQGAAYLIQADWLPPLGRKCGTPRNFCPRRAPGADPAYPGGLRGPS